MGIGFFIQTIVVDVFILVCTLIYGRKNKGFIDKMLAYTIEEKDYKTFDFHVESRKEAEDVVLNFSDICKKCVKQMKMEYYFSLAFEEIIFNILEYQSSINETNPNIDAHIVFYNDGKLLMRIKDCSKERNPFEKYEYCKEDNKLENIGINMVKKYAKDIKYSFIYGMNFLTITV